MTRGPPGVSCCNHLHASISSHLRLLPLKECVPGMARRGIPFEVYESITLAQMLLYVCPILQFFCPVAVTMASILSCMCQASIACCMLSFLIGWSSAIASFSHEAAPLHLRCTSAMARVHFIWECSALQQSLSSDS